MKTKFIVRFIRLNPDLFCSVIEVTVLQRKSIFHKWAKTDVVKATCKSWNCYEGFEWYNNSTTARMCWTIEEQAQKIAEELLEKRLNVLPGMVDWDELKQRIKNLEKIN